MLGKLQVYCYFSAWLYLYDLNTKNRLYFYIEYTVIKDEQHITSRLYLPRTSVPKRHITLIFICYRNVSIQLQIFKAFIDTFLTPSSLSAPFIVPPYPWVQYLPLWRLVILVRNNTL